MTSPIGPVAGELVKHLAGAREAQTKLHEALRGVAATVAKTAPPPADQEEPAP